MANIKKRHASVLDRSAKTSGAGVGNVGLTAAEMDNVASRRVQFRVRGSVATFQYGRCSGIVKSRWILTCGGH
jgi:hypothetical protein